MKWLILLTVLSVASPRAEEWQKVAFIGDAEVKSISGLVEVSAGESDRILHERDTAKLARCCASGAELKSCCK